MTKEEALNVIKQAVRAIQANLDVHTQIQTALTVIEHELLQKDAPTPPAVEKKTTKK